MTRESAPLQARLHKRELVREHGLPFYPDRFERTHSLGEARSLADGTAPVAVAGRIVAMRVMGKLSFLTLQDVSGRCQVSIAHGDVGAERYGHLQRLVDLGDFLGVRGPRYTTRVGEPTVQALEYELLGKTLRPLPEKYHGVVDQETLYRQRYLDLLSNRETMDRFLMRSRFVRELRSFLEERGFVEVETPVLTPVASGAAARPFLTRHNGLDLDVFLRIAPETYLKRCIVGGFDRVFEVARCFRNEGMAATHLQDFTMVEYYAAYWNFEDNMRFTQELVQHVLLRLFGRLEVEVGSAPMDFSGDWPRRSFRELLIESCGIDVAEHETADSLRAAIAARGIELEGAEGLGRGNLCDQLYKKTARPELIRPTFLVHHPIDLSPLARRSDADPQVADRFQLVVNGWEVVNAYSELVDPIDQRERLEAQARLKSHGDEEAMSMDEDYLLAMEHGMPPMSGWGMGVDRFFALISGCENLRDVVLFPLMRPLH